MALIVIKAAVANWYDYPVKEFEVGQTPTKAEELAAAKLCQSLTQDQKVPYQVEVCPEIN